MLDTAERLPWAGHSARHALGEMYDLIRAHRTTLVFVNTRSQAEMLFQALWGINDDGLAIALHHGSLDAAQRRKVEAAMAAGKLRGRGVHLLARSRHRLGRCRSRHQCRRAEGRLAADAAHRPRQSPARRALAGGAGPGQPLRGAGMPRGDRRRWRRMRRIPRRCAPARSTCWPSMCWAAPAANPFLPTNCIAEVRTAAPYADLSRADFDAVVDFVATGGYALKSL